MFLSRLGIVFLMILICLMYLGRSATLHPDEVDALRQIGRTLGKKWDFSVDPCSGERNWTTNEPKGFENRVNCNCTFANNTICHVVGILLKSQSLQGTVPRELVRLPFLQHIDLSRNYLNGTIPKEWGTFQQLVNISLLANRITGSIPGELANISTLTDLVLEYNHLSGNIPPQFGDFASIRRLVLTSNNLTGALPSTLAKLTTLTQFRIGDNKFSGSIPDFIENWTSLKLLYIQASGLSGPIPSSIGSLTQLSDVRITDLNGNDSTFPPLSNNKNLEFLILRSCNIIGQIPSFVGEMTKLTDLDLSFNKLSGKIPQSFVGLSPNAKHIYLTGNSLTGSLPAWMWKEDKAMIDLSYNNFTFEGILSDCQHGKLNLFKSSKDNTTGLTPCLRSFSCKKETYSLHINCGGEEKVDDKGTTYETDVKSGGPANFVSRKNWAFSSTGHFMDNPIIEHTYISRSISNISGQNPELYMDARLSPLSLTYYGFCLANGNYTVTLHFAEITFTDDETYRSLGRRIFDVYVQGKLVLEDFNIEDEAGGVNKAILKHFPAIVSDNTLEIRLYWAGKGTTAIPNKGVYGPLISAISVNAGTL